MEGLETNVTDPALSTTDMQASPDRTMLPGTEKANEPDIQVVPKSYPHIPPRIDAELYQAVVPEWIPPNPDIIVGRCTDDTGAPCVMRKDMLRLKSVQDFLVAARNLFEPSRPNLQATSSDSQSRYEGLYWTADSFSSSNGSQMQQKMTRHGQQLWSMESVQLVPLESDAPALEFLARHNFCCETAWFHLTCELARGKDVLQAEKAIAFTERCATNLIFSEWKDRLQREKQENKAANVGQLGALHGAYSHPYSEHQLHYGGSTSGSLDHHAVPSVASPTAPETKISDTADASAQRAVTLTGSSTEGNHHPAGASSHVQGCIVVRESGRILPSAIIDATPAPRLTSTSNPALDMGSNASSAGAGMEGFESDKGVVEQGKASGAAKCRARGLPARGGAQSDKLENRRRWVVLMRQIVAALRKDGSHSELLPLPPPLATGTTKAPCGASSSSDRPPSVTCSSTGAGQLELQEHSEQACMGLFERSGGQDVRISLLEAQRLLDEACELPPYMAATAVNSSSAAGTGSSSSSTAQIAPGAGGGGGRVQRLSVAEENDLLDSSRMALGEFVKAILTCRYWVAEVKDTLYRSYLHALDVLIPLTGNEGEKASEVAGTVAISFRAESDTSDIMNKLRDLQTEGQQLAVSPVMEERHLQRCIQGAQSLLSRCRLLVDACVGWEALLLRPFAEDGVTRLAEALATDALADAAAAGSRGGGGAGTDQVWAAGWAAPDCARALDAEFSARSRYLLCAAQVREALLLQAPTKGCLQDSGDGGAAAFTKNGQLLSLDDLEEVLLSAVDLPIKVAEMPYLHRLWRQGHFLQKAVDTVLHRTAMLMQSTKATQRVLSSLLTAVPSAAASTSASTSSSTQTSSVGPAASTAAAMAPSGSSAGSGGAGSSVALVASAPSAAASIFTLTEVRGLLQLLECFPVAVPHTDALKEMLRRAEAWRSEVRSLDVQTRSERKRLGRAGVSEAEAAPGKAAAAIPVVSLKKVDALISEGERYPFDFRAELEMLREKKHLAKLWLEKLKRSFVPLKSGSNRLNAIRKGGGAGGGGGLEAAGPERPSLRDMREIVSEGNILYQPYQPIPVNFPVPAHGTQWCDRLPGETFEAATDGRIEGARQSESREVGKVVGVNRDLDRAHAVVDTAEDWLCRVRELLLDGDDTEGPTEAADVASIDRQQLSAEEVADRELLASIDEDCGPIAAGTLHHTPTLADDGVKEGDAKKDEEEEEEEQEEEEELGTARVKEMMHEMLQEAEGMPVVIEETVILKAHLAALDWAERVRPLLTASESKQNLDCGQEQAKELSQEAALKRHQNPRRGGGGGSGGGSDELLEGKLTRDPSNSFRSGLPRLVELQQFAKEITKIQASVSTELRRSFPIKPVPEEQRCLDLVASAERWLAKVKKLTQGGSLRKGSTLSRLRLLQAEGQAIPVNFHQELRPITAAVLSAEEWLEKNRPALRKLRIYSAAGDANEAGDSADAESLVVASAALCCAGVLPRSGEDQSDMSKKSEGPGGSPPPPPEEGEENVEEEEQKELFYSDLFLMVNAGVQLLVEVDEVRQAKNVLLGVDKWIAKVRSVCRLKAKQSSTAFFVGEIRRQSGRDRASQGEVIAAASGKASGPGSCAGSNSGRKVRAPKRSRTEKDSSGAETRPGLETEAEDESEGKAAAVDGNKQLSQEASSEQETEVETSSVGEAPPSGQIGLNVADSNTTAATAGRIAISLDEVESLMRKGKSFGINVDEEMESLQKVKCATEDWSRSVKSIFLPGGDLQTLCAAAASQYSHMLQVDPMLATLPSLNLTEKGQDEEQAQLFGFLLPIPASRHAAVPTTSSPVQQDSGAGGETALAMEESSHSSICAALAQVSLLRQQAEAVGVEVPGCSGLVRATAGALEWVLEVRNLLRHLELSRRRVVATEASELTNTRKSSSSRCEIEGYQWEFLEDSYRLPGWADISLDLVSALQDVGACLLHKLSSTSSTDIGNVSAPEQSTDHEKRRDKSWLDGSILASVGEFGKDDEEEEEEEAASERISVEMGAGGDKQGGTSEESTSPRSARGPRPKVFKRPHKARAEIGERDSAEVLLEDAKRKRCRRASDEDSTAGDIASNESRSSAAAAPAAATGHRRRRKRKFVEILDSGVEGADQKEITSTKRSLPEAARAGGGTDVSAEALPTALQADLHDRAVNKVRSKRAAAFYEEFIANVGSDNRGSRGSKGSIKSNSKDIFIPELLTECVGCVGWDSRSSSAAEGSVDKLEAREGEAAEAATAETETSDAVTCEFAQALYRVVDFWQHLLALLRRRLQRALQWITQVRRLVSALRQGGSAPLVRPSLTTFGGDVLAAACAVAQSRPGVTMEQLARWSTRLEWEDEASLLKTIASCAMDLHIESSTRCWLVEHTGKSRDWLLRAQNMHSGVEHAEGSLLTIDALGKFIKEGEATVLFRSQRQKQLHFLRAELRRARAWREKLEASGLFLDGSAGAGAGVGGSVEQAEAMLQEAQDICVDLSEYSDALSQANRTYCLCRQLFFGEMVACDLCDEWYHISCVGLSSAQAERCEKYVCVRCALRNSFLQSANLAAELTNKWMNCLDHFRARELQFNKISKKLARDEREYRKAEAAVRALDVSIPAAAGAGAGAAAAGTAAAGTAAAGTAAPESPTPNASADAESVIGMSVGPDADAAKQVLESVAAVVHRTQQDKAVLVEKVAHESRLYAEITRWMLALQEILWPTSEEQRILGAPLGLDEVRFLGGLRTASAPTASSAAAMADSSPSSSSSSSPPAPSQSGTALQTKATPEQARSVLVRSRLLLRHLPHLLPIGLRHMERAAHLVGIVDHRCQIEDVVVALDAFRWMSWCHLCLHLLRVPPTTPALRRLLEAAKPLQCTDDKILKLLNGILQRAQTWKHKAKKFLAQLQRKEGVLENFSKLHNLNLEGNSLPFTSRLKDRLKIVLEEATQLQSSSQKQHSAAPTATISAPAETTKADDGEKGGKKAKRGPKAKCAAASSTPAAVQTAVVLPSYSRPASHPPGALDDLSSDEEEDFWRKTSGDDSSSAAGLIPQSASVSRGGPSLESILQPLIPAGAATGPRSRPYPPLSLQTFSSYAELPWPPQLSVPRHSYVEPNIAGSGGKGGTGGAGNSGGAGGTNSTGSAGGTGGASGASCTGGTGHVEHSKNSSPQQHGSNIDGNESA